MDPNFSNSYKPQNMKFKILVILVAILAFSTRFINLDSNPPNLSNDEISIAYDAYSVSKTLRDEHNHFLPLSFQSHSTYKTPLTVYLSIPTTIIFGNSEIAARIPSALLGSLTVLVLGLLVFELTKNKNLSLLSSYILAVSPMHILTSRMAYEPNIALFFFLSGIYLFLLSLRKNSSLAILTSFVSFALSIYGYHTEWIFTPFIIILLFALNYKPIYKKPGYYIGVFIFLVLILPIFFDFLNNLHTTTRASTENLLKEPSLARKLEASYPVWQKVSFVLESFLGKYSSYFNLSYIFFTGYNLLPEGDPFQAGVFLFPLLPFFLIGIYKGRGFFKENSVFIYTLLITSPITASLTSGPQSTSRNLVTLISISIFCSVGILVFWKWANRIWRVFFITIMAISFLYFLTIFYYHFPKDGGERFQYGYKQIALFIKPRYQDFKQIIIDPRFGPGNMYSGVPHLYIPYYTNLDPNKLLQSKSDKTGSYFDKYQIRDINWQKEKLNMYTLYIIPASNIPDKNLNLKEVYMITLPNYQPAFYLYTLDNHN